MTIDYHSVAEAREASGLRLALTAHMPAPYSMSARAVLDLKGVSYLPVEQVAAGPNEALVDWTGHRNAPVAVFENEAPRAGWLEILNLAERLGSGPSLFPDQLTDRIAMVGLVNEMIGENGMVWFLRLILLGMGGPERAAEAAQTNPMYADYGYSEAALVGAEARVHGVLEAIKHQLARQVSANRKFLFGDRLSAADVYWAYFSQLLDTLPEPICPMPSFLRRSYDAGGSAVGGCPPALLAHRDRVFSHHLETPLTF